MVKVKGERNIMKQFNVSFNHPMVKVKGYYIIPSRKSSHSFNHPMVKVKDSCQRKRRKLGKSFNHPMVKVKVNRS